MDDIELESLLKQFRSNGDDRYFEKIYRHLIPGIYRFLALQLKNNDTAEDLAGEVFLKAYKYLKNYNMESVFIKPLLYKIARNTLIDHYRKEKKRKNDISFENNFEYIENRSFKELKYEQANNISDPESSEMKNEELIKGLNGLPDLQKQVLILRYVEDMDYGEIAKVLNKREGALRALKYRGLNALKVKLAQKQKDF